MNFKILKSMTETAETRNNILVIGTHNGLFHSDEVVACAILCLTNSDKHIHILRSRDQSMLNLCDICVDIGGGTYDHHQAGFNKARKNNIKYASAGLVWKDFGKQLIKQFLVNYFNDTHCDLNYIFKLFDNEFILPVDCEDNGCSTNLEHCFKFISSFLPLWFELNDNESNKQFAKALSTTIIILKEELKTTIGKVVSEELVLENWHNQNYSENSILELPSQAIEWLETVININASIKDSHINFVIFPYPNGGWAAQCVPPSLENKFGQRVPFPKKWAGQTKNLPIISGIAGATFCHNGCFFIRATDKESIVKMCELALDSAK